MTDLTAPKKYAYSLDDETFTGSFDAFQDAISAVIEKYGALPGAKIFIGEVEPVLLEQVINVNTLLDYLLLEAYSWPIACVDELPVFNQDELKELHLLIVGYLLPRFTSPIGRVIKSLTHTVTQRDIYMLMINTKG